MRRSQTYSTMEISEFNNAWMVLVKFVLVLLLLFPFLAHAQWGTTGNTGAANQWLGTNNGFPLAFKTNNTERFSISSAGIYKFNGLSGTGNGLMFLNSSGEVSRLGFSGTGTQVLTGAGTFTGIVNLTGWGVPSTGTTVTANKVGIGISAPVQALEVSGNILATGYVVAEQFIVSDIAKVGGTMTMNNNVIMNGYDPIMGLRNELYTTTQPYYLQSAPLYDYNTIINHGNTGKVGIGTNTPSAKFHVEGNSRFDGTVRMDSLQLGDGLVLKSGTSGGLSSFSVGPVGGMLGYFLPLCISKGTATHLQSVKGFYSAYSNTGSVTMGHNGTDAIIQSYGDGAAGTLKLNAFCGNDVAICSGVSGGNVGVGTSTPEDKLQVKTGAYSLTIGSALYSGLSYGTSYMGFNALRTSAGTWKTDTDGTHNGGAVLYSNVLGDVFLATLPHTGSAAHTGISDSAVLAGTRLYIASTEQTGIGTRCIPGGYKMAVDGRIMCEGVRVKYSDSTGCWPDYVFDQAYAPMSIAALENYVQANKHLPGVPSEKQVMDEGVDLVEMNKALLKATEENSLYIIAIKKENDEMKRQLIELRQLIEKR